MSAPTDDVTAFWILASKRVPLDASILAWCPVAPGLLLANVLYAVRPETLSDLDRDLGRAAQRTERFRIMIDDDTPAWVEAELLLRGWQVESEFRLVLPRGKELERPAELTPVRRADVVDADWTGRAAMFRIDHLEEDARHGVEPRPQSATDEVVEHRRRLERYGTYLCVTDRGAVAGFVCCWLSDAGGGVIEDVFVHPDHRGQGLATAMINSAVARLRQRGAGAITIAAEVGDTPVQLYAGLGFSPFAVTRCYALTSLESR